MLELYFKYPRVLRRLRDGELGGEMDRIAGYISEAGYKRESVKIYLSRLGRCSAYHAASRRGGRQGHAGTGEQIHISPRLATHFGHDVTAIERGLVDDPGMAWPFPGRHHASLRGR